MIGSNRWSLILAAGAGTRLARLTSDGRGTSVPKQFCSLNGGASLLEDAIARARRVTAPERILVVVAQEHRAHWLSLALTSNNIIVQPANRGTANGILLGVTAVMQRDPEAILTVLPSDHYVEKEHVLQSALEQALVELEGNAASKAVNFLGIEPDVADPELGYIVYAGERAAGSYAVEQFVEKPSRDRAAALLRRCALWNSFILVARAKALVSLIGRRFPKVVSGFRHAWSVHVRNSASQVFDHLYERLPTIDFSRSVVEGAEVPLRVVPVPQCGWSDLGTPQRVGSCLERQSGCRRGPRTDCSPHLNLADAYLRRVTGTYTSA